MLDALALGLAGAVTYCLRVAFLISSRVKVPAAFSRWLPFVGPAVMGAIAFPGLVAPHDVISFAETIPALMAAATAWVLWRRSKQMVVGLLGGLGAWWVILLVVASV